MKYYLFFILYTTLFIFGCHPSTSSKTNTHDSLVVYDNSTINKTNTYDSLSINLTDMAINDIFKLRIDVYDGKYDCNVETKNNTSYYHCITKRFSIKFNNNSPYMLYFDKQFNKIYLLIGKYFEIKPVITPCYVFALLDKDMNIKRQIRTPFTPYNSVFLDFGEEGQLTPYFMTKYVTKGNLITHEQGIILPKSFSINTKLSTVFECLEKPISKENSINLKICCYSNNKKDILSHNRDYFLQKYVNMKHIYKSLIFPVKYYE